MPLSDTAIRAAKPASKAFKLSDEKGLYLFITPAGGKLWRYNYRFGGIRKTLAIGQYPEVTLKDARARLDDARKLLANEIDPGVVKKAQKAAKHERAANSFEIVARRWHEKNMAHWTPAYAKRNLQLLERDVFAWIGGEPIADLEAPKFLEVARRIEKRGAIETAHRALQACSQIMRFAVAEGLASRDPVGDLRGALKTAPVKHMASVTDPVRVAEILRMFDAFQGTFPVQCALKLAPMVFTGPGELRQAQWADIDLEAGLWSIPAEKMKMRQAHIVPLSCQAVEILRELHPLTGHLEHAFPGARDPKRSMSEAAINAAMRRLGIDTQEELTGHGFRAMARTILHEVLGYPPEVIEQQLAHKAAGPLGEAYARAKFLDQRVEMMQMWSDYLEKLKAGAEVIPFKAAS